MRRSRILSAIAGLAVTLTLAITASASAGTTTYRVAGIEIRETPATFVGSLVGQIGLWQAVVDHAALDSAPGHTTAITGGSFTIKPLGPTVSGTITGGTLTAGSVSGGLFCVQKFTLGGSGTLTGGGAFDGVLVHYGVRRGTGCDAFAASFSGSVTITS